MFEVGAAIKDITAFHKGTGMMGYGMHFNTVEEVETPLHVRAYFFHHPDSGESAVIGVCDMCFITTSVKRGVLKKLARKHPDLKIEERNLMLLAQHTHSGPGGYSHYGLYNVSIPGFVPRVYTAIVAGITDAIVEAAKQKKPAELRFESSEFEPTIPVAFNRSMKAFLSNSDAPKLSLDQTHLAVDRSMHMLRMDGKNGDLIGAINWFGVHTTSVHNDNHRICWDNKGYAANFLEREIRQNPSGNNFLGAFAQGAAGDVTPNHVWDRKKKWTRGPYEDDFESARHNGRLQADLAAELFEKCSDEKCLITGGIDAGLLHANLSNVHCNPEYSNGLKNARTGPACHGVAFFEGTREGPGMPKPIAFAAKRIARMVKMYELATNRFRTVPNRKAIRLKYRVQGPKDIVIESGERRILGTSDVKNFIVPGFVDPTIRNIKALHPQGWDEDKPWTPHVLPLQILILGEIAFVGIPAEPTTMAGQRIRKVVESSLLDKGIRKVVIAPYANAYCGYITTFEEYQHQCYEGGHTVFGQWSLAAFQTKYKQLADEMAKTAHFREFLHDELPPEFTKEEIERRSYPKMKHRLR
jgi:neutral ceramidase